MLALFELVGAAARHSQTAVIVFIDEMQFLPSAERSALINTLHHCAQKALPVALVGAGLPQLRTQMAEIGSLAERLFEVFELGPTAASPSLSRRRSAALSCAGRLAHGRS